MPPGPTHRPGTVSPNWRTLTSDPSDRDSAVGIGPSVVGPARYDIPVT